VAKDDDITTEVGSEFHSIMLEGKKLWQYALILDCGTTNFLLWPKWYNLLLVVSKQLQE